MGDVVNICAVGETATETALLRSTSSPQRSQSRHLRFFGNEIDLTGSQGSTTSSLSRSVGLLRKSRCGRAASGPHEQGLPPTEGARRENEKNHVLALRAKLNVLTQEQAVSTGAKIQGPFRGWALQLLSGKVISGSVFGLLSCPSPVINVNDRGNSAKGASEETTTSVFTMKVGAKSQLFFPSPST